MNDEKDDDTVNLDFDTASAHLLDNHGECDDYDALTLFKTAQRLQNKISVFPMDIQQALSANTDVEDDKNEHNHDVPDLLLSPIVGSERFYKDA